MTIVDDIRSLKIQGATDVALAALEALQKQAEKSSDKSLMSDLRKKAKELASTRPTEPMMRSALKYALHFVEQADNKRKYLKVACKNFKSTVEKANQDIVEIGARRIGHFPVVMTHCHSETVTSILKRAKPNVICTESRPKYQGRITAMELAKAGLKVELIVDSAVNRYIKGVDCVIVGSDAITSEGNNINKIGTSQIALCAESADIPFYVASSLLKFDPETTFGAFEEIEQRDPSEVWDKKHKNLKVRNPAFDITPHDRIESFITEFGVHASESVYDLIQEHYPWALRGLE